MPPADETIAKPSRTQNARSARLPAYRERAPYGRAIVTLVDAKTKRRKDFWLGEFGSPESKEAYNRLIAEWLSNGRLLPPSAAPSSAEVAGSTAALTVNELALAFWKHAQSYYDARMQGHLKVMIRIVRRYFGSTPAVEFGPKALMLVRDAMVDGDRDSDPPRKPWSRKYVNAQILRLCGMFRWGASVEMVPASLHVQLRTVPALRKGKTKAIDGVRPHAALRRTASGAGAAKAFKPAPVNASALSTSGSAAGSTPGRT